jgi:DNA-binding response OmpR family regulator
VVSKRVLIVEDEGLLRRTLASAFRDAGFTAFGAGSAEEAEEFLFPEVSVDLVVLDNRLPRTDGVSLLRRLRQGPSGCPVILMTAFDKTETRKAAEEWANGYVVKPFDLSRMIGEVRRVLGNGQTSRESVIPRPCEAVDPVHESPRR